MDRYGRRSAPQTDEQPAVNGRHSRHRREEKKSRSKWLVLLLLLLLVIAIGVTIWALFFRDTQTVLAPDYAPQQEEQYAEDYDDGDNDKLPQSEGGGAVSLTYSTEVKILLAENTAEMYFVNPGKSNQDMLLQLVIRDEVIAQSGKISPGKQVQKLELLEGAADKLQPGGYEGKLMVLYYQPDSGEKSIVNTEIPVNITVE